MIANLHLIAHREQKNGNVESFRALCDTLTAHQAKHVKIYPEAPRG